MLASTLSEPAGSKTWIQKLSGMGAAAAGAAVAAAAGSAIIYIRTGRTAGEGKGVSTAGVLESLAFFGKLTEGVKQGQALLLFLAGVLALLLIVVVTRVTAQVRRCMK